MDESKVFELLCSTLWQDFRGFLREEFNKDRGTVYLPPVIKDMFLFFVFLVFSPLILLFSPKLLFRSILSPFRRRKIAKVSFDIEVTTNIFKLIRNQNGEYGLCMWKNYFENKLLLRPKFDRISHSGKNIFILKKKGLFGLYNAEIRKVVLECQYTSISNLHDDIFSVIQNGKVNKFNGKGDRILL